MVEKKLWTSLKKFAESPRNILNSKYSEFFKKIALKVPLDINLEKKTFCLKLQFVRYEQASLHPWLPTGFFKFSVNSVLGLF